MSGNSFSTKQFPWRIFYRTFLVQVAIITIALSASGIAARYFFKRQFLEQVKSQMEGALHLIAHNATSFPSSNWCAAMAQNTGVRLTVVAEKGSVICDSELDVGGEQDYLSRPEIQAALADKFGESIRYSSLKNEDTFYGALFLPAHGIVLRGAIPLSRLSNVIRIFDTSLFLFLTSIAILLAVIEVWLARQLVFPLGRLLLKTERLIARKPDVISKEELVTEPFGEWSELESNIDNIRKRLESTTQTLRMEQVELDMVMAAINDAILAVDQDGMPLFFNSKFELLFNVIGLRSQPKKLWEIFREPEILEAYRGALSRGKTATTKLIPIDREGEARRFFQLAVSPLRRPGNVIYGVLGIFHDVTDLKMAEKMRIDFVANVSHELRTPLTSIKGYAETIRTDLDAKKPADGNTKEYLTVILRNANRLMAIMEDLLDLSSLESSTIIQPEPIDTKEFTTRVLKQILPNVNAKEQTVDTVFDATTVVADSNRLEQVLVNLLDNANKYTPPKGRIRVEWIAQGKDVFLKVVDSGPGIPIQHQGRLFERFYRIDKARSREQGGTGLGLAIVKHIMQRHQGTVWVESRPGEGSTFICQFPQDTAS